MLDLAQRAFLRNQPLELYLHLLWQNPSLDQVQQDGSLGIPMVSVLMRIVY
jgi:glutaredoxin-related protein